MNSNSPKQNAGLTAEATDGRTAEARLAAAELSRSSHQPAAWLSAVLLLCLVLDGPAQTYSVLYSFSGVDGACPEARLVVSGTNLYGTTCGGGIANAGTIFRLREDGGDFTVLHHFASFADGVNPQAGLALSGSTLYGTTCGGGISNYLCAVPSGKPGAACGGSISGGGTVFKINQDGSGFAVLHRFAGPDFPTSTWDGLSPQSGLSLSGSVLYGTTFQGGRALCPGSVFKLNTDGSAFAVLAAGVGPWSPDGGLAISSSTIYGTSCSGGILSPGSGYGGEVFRMNSDGSGLTVLKAFLGGNDGAAPYGDLLLSGTTLYGTTSGNGNGNAGNGTVFKVGVDGSGYAVLKNFTGGDGSSSRTGLILVGNTLYGTTSAGGSFGQGAVFKVNTDGSDFAVLKSFAGGSDGANPFGELVLSGATLYGTAAAGGAFGNGVVFSLSMAPALLAPLVSQTAEAGTAAVFKTAADGAPPLIFLWFFQGTNLLTAGANSLLQLTNLETLQAGAYSVVITNGFSALTSAPAMLSVVPPVPRRAVPALNLTGQQSNELILDNSTNLAPVPNWSAFDRVTLENPSQWYFDLSAPAPQRFYRAWHTNTLSIAPLLALHLIQAITLDGAAGASVRVDCINQIGPVDAWVPLATVALTNPPQLYFDTGAVGQPQRLYRIVPLR